MERDKIEENVIERSAYIKRLHEEYARPDEYGYFLAIIESIIERSGGLKVFQGHKTKGRIILYVGRRLVRLHEEFVENMLVLINDEVGGRARWEKFLPHYRENLIKYYKEFVNNESDLLILFEIVNRKIIRDILTLKTTAPYQLTSESIVKVSNMINSLFFYARKTLAGKFHFDDSLIVESYERAVFAPRVEERELLKLLASPIQNKKMSIIFFDLLATHFKDVVAEVSEQKLRELIPRRNIFFREDLKKTIASYPLAISETTINKILTDIKEKLASQLNQLVDEKSGVLQRVNDLKTRLREYSNTFGQRAFESVQNFSTQEIMRSMINEMSTPFFRMGFYLRDLENQHRDLTRKEEGIKNLMQVSKEDVLSWAKKIPCRHLVELVLLDKDLIKLDEMTLQKELKEGFRVAKGYASEQEVMNLFKKGGIFAEKYETEQLLDQFQVVIKEVVKPMVLTFLLEELIEYFPPLGTISQENLKFLAERIAGEGVYYLSEEKKTKLAKGADVTADMTEIDRFQATTSVLVYDIRGSTFMGTKLKNAQKENEIRNLFNKAMLEVIHKYGGIPIKDTGDGGLVFFCANGREILAGLERGDMITNLEPSCGRDIGCAAARCACEMVSKAQEFVQENLLRYSEWFKDVEERELKFEGVTLATLPPEYKKIFQIGIGISSGLYPREVYMDRNVFGDIDISGMLVREANIFSKAKNPTGSIIMCDDATVYNLILNAQKFSFYSEEGIKLDPVISDVIQALDHWFKLREQRRGFIIEIFKILAKRVDGKITYDKDGKMFAMLGDGLILKDEGQYLDAKGGRTKYLFELTRG